MKITRSVSFILAASILQIGSLFFPSFTLAANLTAAKNTLQSSRMSFNGRATAPTIAGSSHVWIYTSVSGNATSVSTAGLKPGDTLTIGTGTSYVIASIIDDDEFTITTTLAAGDADEGELIFMKSKPQHVITFTTASAVNGGFFRVLIPAGASGNDGLPDITGFDMASSSVTPTAANATGYTFTTPVATAAGTTGCTSPANYHCFEFHYIGTGTPATPITLTLGNTGGTANLIAPAPSAGRVAYTADTYTFIVQNFSNTSDPNSATATDDVQGKIAVIESVRVTATVDPSITFKIEGNTVGTHCGFTTDVATTATAVPFGVLVIDTFKTASQKLTVSTNAVAGYAVTAVENERLSNLAGSPSYIPNTLCDSGSCTYNGAGSAWATAAAHPGFGYTMAVVSGVTPVVIPIAPAYRPFGTTPTQIMSYTTISSTHVADVCYKISVDATQAAGDYENQVTYTATATF